MPSGGAETSGLPLISPPDAGIDSLLNRLTAHYGVDLADYKRSWLVGRVRRRMDQVRIVGFPAYERFSGSCRGVQIAFANVFVNYTTFFRDPAVWNEVVRRVLPAIMLLKSKDEPIRMWCVGCSSGEEAYALAIIASEMLGQERFQSHVKIFATGIDSQNVRVAREGSYRPESLNLMHASLRGKYFTLKAGRCLFKPELREPLVFGSHNVLRDPPLLRIDLLLCRNMLMYFTAAAQYRTVMGFHRALGQGGYLILGAAETAPDHRLFTADRHRLGLYSTAVCLSRPGHG